MSNFDTIHPVNDEGPLYRVYGRQDWHSIANTLRRRRHQEGHTWTEIETRVIVKTTPGEIRKRIAAYLSPEDLLDLQIAQWPGERPKTEHYPDETGVNEIGIKRIRQKKGAQKNEYPPSWTTMIRLPARELTPRAAEHQAKLWRVRESGRLANLAEKERTQERATRTEREEFEFQLQGYNAFEQAQMRKERKARRIQEWIDKRQEDRENAPKLRAHAIEVQRQRAAAGSPIKRRTE